MRAVAAASPLLAGVALKRAKSALARLDEQKECDEMLLREEFQELRNLVR